MNIEKRPAAWEEIAGHQAAIARIRRMLEKDRLPHALLFAGPSGIGKRIVAEVFAAQVLQTETTLLEAHPDFFSVTCDGAQIRIGQIREIQRLAGFAPVRGPHRVCLLEPADCMEPPAANSLLKILEEPPAGLIFILITAFPHSLLSTLRSRAATIRFVRPAGGVFQGEDARAAEAADRQQAIEFLRNIQRPDLEWLWPTLSGMDALENSQILDIIRQWIWVLRDVGILLTAGTGMGTFSADRMEELRPLTGQWDIPRIGSAIKLAEDTRRHLQRNANSRLMLESLLIRSADLYWGGNVNANHRGSPV